MSRTKAGDRVNPICVFFKTIAKIINKDCKQRLLKKTGILPGYEITVYPIKIGQ